MFKWYRSFTKEYYLVLIIGTYKTNAEGLAVTGFKALIKPKS